jgi:hypothetical protein
MTGYEFRNGPWKDINWLIQNTQEFYDTYVTPKGLGDRFTLAKEKIIKKREWGPSLQYTDAHFDAVIRELGIFYVPAQMKPGPCIVFPQMDYRSILTTAKFYPFYELSFGGPPAKYASLGKVEEGTPSWFGDTDHFLKSVHHFHSVLIVEGFFDLLAIRLLAPHVPVISSGTKRLNDAHIDYLGLLGVKTGHLMFDNEPAKDGKPDGAGNMAMTDIIRKYNGRHGIQWSNQRLNEEDASDSLKDRRAAFVLRRRLNTMFPLEAVSGVA